MVTYAWTLSFRGDVDFLLEGGATILIRISTVDSVCNKKSPAGIAQFVSPVIGCRKNSFRIPDCRHDGNSDSCRPGSRHCDRFHLQA